MKVMLTGAFADGVPEYLDVSGFDIEMKEVFIGLTGMTVLRPILSITTPEAIICWQDMTGTVVESASVLRVLVASQEVVPYVCTDSN